MQGFAKVWGFIAVILPSLIGLALILTPEAAITIDTSASELAVTLGFRNLTISLVLLYSLLRRYDKVTGFLLIARGLTELGDAVSYILLYQQIGISIIVTFFLAILSFISAYYFLKNGSKLPVTSELKT